jgi:hypothetical protein
MFFAAALAGAFLSGCGTTPDSGSKGGSDPSERTEGSEPADSSGSSRPPESTLSYGGQSVTGELGSYCWSWSSGAICADVVGPPVPDEEETLTVPAGSVMVFEFGGSRRLRSMRAVAYPLDRGNEVRSPHGPRFLEPSKGRSMLATKALKVRREGGTGDIPAELPEGEYVVEVFIRLLGGGSASYYFRVVVE